jgi:hypothetical protein
MRELIYLVEIFFNAAAIPAPTESVLPTACRYVVTTEVARLRGKRVIGKPNLMRAFNFQFVGNFQKAFRIRLSHVPLRI